ncbi:CHAT domain-containing protein [Tunicatimonas pelagia]|uniref:CHAT domain-containing protein n=1 Tax=Tunicatimonas pelagia TaxID=931531 RepID=UPI0026666697|nr:CHAT domain-containing tetratricopeptide repeat protein [Tunicatimonas pelagia]WKN43435.1 CHAT domain-containing protein [Tunicatimonas pelagia]
MRRFVFCFLSLFTLTLPLYAQPDTLVTYQQAESYYNTDVPTAETDSLALVNYLKVIDELSGDNSVENAPFLLDSYEKAGIIHQIYERNEQAVGMYQSAIHTAEKFSLSDSLLYRPYLYIGNAYYALHSFDSSLVYLKKAEELLGLYNLEEADRIYNALGMIYYEAGNYEQSINYFSRALEALNKLGINDPQATFTFTSNIASALGLLKKYDLAATMYKSLIPLGLELNEVYLNLGATYLEEKKTNDALYYLNKIDSTKSSDLKQIIKYVSIGNALLLQKKTSSAKDEALKALKLLKSDSTVSGEEFKGNRYAGDVYRLLGETSLQQDQLQEALRYYQRAIIQFDYGFSDTTVFSNPHDFASAFSNFALFGSLTAKAHCLELLYQQNQTSDYLVAALDTYQSAFKMADYVNKWFDNENARLFLADEVLPAYQQAVAFAVSAYEHTQNPAHLETAFRWAEQSKANALAAALKENTVRNYTGLPDSLLTQERTLQQNLSRLFLQIDQAETEEEIGVLETEIRDTELALSRLQDRLHDFPAYRQQKFQYDSLDITFLQQEVLDKQSAVLSYFLSDSIIYLFALQSQQLTYYTAPRDSVYANNLQRLQLELRTIKAGQSYQGAKLAKRLYEQLLLPTQTVLNKTSSLIIIPHQELNYLPFESLINPQDDYLLASHSVSYQYTASFLQSDPVLVDNLNSALALAPFSANEAYEPTGLSPLTYSVTETAQLGGVILEHREATKANFLRYSDDASIIHLATHAVANNEDPSRSYIAFYPYTEADSAYKLFAHELYNLPLQETQLAFLSACETATGKMISGEGIMSLSRAFAYAGCPNLITSLWKAEDNATAYLSERFYQYLSKEYSIADALRQAKLDLLNNLKLAQFHAPTYWSHLVFVGTPRSSQLSTVTPWIIGSAGVLAVLLIFMWLHTKRK